MAIIRSKGMALGIGAANSVAAVAQVLSIDYSGLKSNTFEATVLDGTTYQKKLQTGFSSPGQISAELFFDPATMSVFTGPISTPAEFGASITFPGNGGASWAFKAAGMEFGMKAALEDGVKASVTIELTDAPTF